MPVNQVSFIPEPTPGCLVINADDWGRDRATTTRTEECFVAGAISSVSAMVFMEDSDRAALIAVERGVDVGFHLNLTTPFTARRLPTTMEGHLERVSEYLRRRRLAQAVFHPGLAKSFEYLVSSQLEEFQRIYGAAPTRMDGHHHMHLCSNVVLQGLIPQGVTIRRNFSFQSGEKGLLNRLYRKCIDGWLLRVHPMTDYFFSLPPLQAHRLKHMVELSRKAVVEVETHPINPDEYDFLRNGQLLRDAENVKIASGYTTRMIV